MPPNAARSSRIISADARPTPKRRRNGDLRTREYLTVAEVEKLMAATKGNRWGHRDAMFYPCRRIYVAATA